MIFGNIEEFISEELYPYRWPIIIGLVIATAGVLAFAYWRGWHRTLWRHKLATALVGVPLLIVAVIAGDYLISPLFERSLACEASPIAGAGAGSEECEEQAAVSVDTSGAQDAPDNPVAGVTTPTPSTDESAFEASVVHQGEFHGADDFHFGEGKALLIETAPGVYALRFEEFSVRNGPDLYVYLSTDAEDYGDGSLELGTLKATDGAFNYEVPAGTDISRYRSAIVWCKQFSVLFAAAPLNQ